MKSIISIPLYHQPLVKAYISSPTVDLPTATITKFPNIKAIKVKYGDDVMFVMPYQILLKGSEEFVSKSRMLWDDVINLSDGLWLDGKCGLCGLVVNNDICICGAKCPF